MDNSERARKLAAPPLGWMPGDSLAPGRRSKARRAAANERRFLQPSDPRQPGSCERWRLIVSGQVQGVGYRAACCQKARQLDLNGWVRNQHDGTVEVQAEGQLHALTELRLWCERGPEQAEVLSVSQGQLAPIREDWFEIRR